MIAIDRIRKRIREIVKGVSMITFLPELLKITDGAHCPQLDLTIEDGQHRPIGHNGKSTTIKSFRQRVITPSTGTIGSGRSVKRRTKTKSKTRCA